MTEILASRVVRQLTAPTLFDALPDNDDDRDQADSSDLIPPVACEPWCTEGTGHPDPLETGAQTCRSEPVRIESQHGGGTGYAPAPTHTGTIVLQAQRNPGCPTTIVVGLELGGTEHWLNLTASEAANVGTQLLQLTNQAA